MKSFFKILIADKRAFTKIALLLCAIALAAGISAVGITQAWYRINTDIGATNSTVTSSKGDTSLFIESGDIITGVSNYQDDYNYSISTLSETFTGNLYPISSNTRSSWYRVNTWSGSSPATYVQVSSITQSDSTNTDRWNYTVDSKTYTAYNKLKYTVYCNNEGAMNVYFNPTNGFTVSAVDSNAKELIKSIRVGMTVTTGSGVESDFIFVYAPNSDTFNHVTGTSTVANDTRVKTSLADYTATGSSGSYSGSGKTALFVSDYDGVIVNLYVWLEGTDPDAVLGKADNANGIKVDFNLVGIATR